MGDGLGYWPALSHADSLPSTREHMNRLSLRVTVYRETPTWRTHDKDFCLPKMVQPQARKPGAPATPPGNHETQFGATTR